MKFRHVAIVAIVTGLIGWAAGTGFGEDTPPSTAQLIEAMRQSGMPGEKHRNLDPLVGRWDVAVKSWQGDKASESTASAMNEWMLGGRFVKLAYKGSLFGSPFNGFGLMGYNNEKQRYEAIWVDDFTSSMHYSLGQASTDGQTITFQGVQDALNEVKIPYRMVYAVTAGGFTVISYATHSGVELKEMEQVYRRATARPTPTPTPTPSPSAPTTTPVVVDPCAPAPVIYYDPCRPCPPPVRCQPRPSSCRPRYWCR